MDFDAHQCEYLLVGHLLNNFDDDKEIFSKLTLLDFQCPLLGQIYDFMKQVYSEGIQRTAEINFRPGHGDKMVGSYIAKIGNSDIRLVNSEAYALIIKEKAEQRKLMQSIELERTKKEFQFERELEDFCDYLEETAEEMRDLEFTKEYSKSILHTMNKQMKRLISLQGL